MFRDSNNSSNNTTANFTMFETCYSNCTGGNDDDLAAFGICVDNCEKACNDEDGCKSVLDSVAQCMLAGNKSNVTDCASLEMINDAVYDGAAFGEACWKANIQNVTAF